MEMAEYKLWYIYTRDDYAKLRKNVEVLSILTWKDLQTILFIENAGCVHVLAIVNSAAMNIVVHVGSSNIAQGDQLGASTT